jgi:hypothetical protein
MLMIADFVRFDGPLAVPMDLDSVTLEIYDADHNIIEQHGVEELRHLSTGRYEYDYTAEYGQEPSFLYTGTVS